MDDGACSFIRVCAIVILKRMILINDKNYPAKLGFKAMRIFQDKTGKDFAQMDDANTKLSDIIVIAWAAMAAQCERENIEFKLEPVDVENAIDDNPELMVKITEMLTGGDAEKLAVLGAEAKN